MSIQPRKKISFDRGVGSSCFSTHLTGELSELRHAHLKLSEKVQELKLQSGENNDMYIRYEKERDIAQAALAELQNAMKEQAKLYEKVQYESKEKDFLFEKKQKELHEVQTKYNELLNDAADAKSSGHRICHGEHAV